jgi:hypothetical protein
MPLQDKSRSDRKVKARKVIGIVNETGEQLCFDSIHDMAECFGIVTQTAYNIIRRKQVFRGLTFRYMDDAEHTHTNRNETEVHSHD